MPLPPKQSWGMTPNLAAEKHGSMEKRRQKGGNRLGPPGPLRRGEKFEGTDTGAKGSLSSMQPGRGDTLFPRAMDIA